jgi:gamma-glutamyltranspeptidase/glutathione hydrolase
MTFSFELPYPSRRVPVLAKQAVATSHPLAAQVGLSVLSRGGNAIDAAIAVAACLTVVEPTMNGLGSDLFALVWDGERVHALNASGRSPKAWSLDRYAGQTAMPELGWDTVTVPGAVSGWVALWRRFGREPFADLLQAGIRYARDGFPVMPRIARAWADAPSRFAEFAEFQRVFLPNGRAPVAGEWFTLPDLSVSLAEIAETTGASFYSGPLAQRIVRAAHDGGGALSAEDLAEHSPVWEEPLSVDFHDARVFEPPPNGQGLAALLALGILRHLPLAAHAVDSPLSIHLQIEAMKLAFYDAHRHVADPARMRVTPRELLAEARLAELARTIRADRAAPPRETPPPDHGTVYVTTADCEGRMVSLIQSNYFGFGSGVVVPGTGISLQNRGRGFSLEPDHPNVVAGGVRPYHTIMPGFLTRGGQPAMSFGVMGAHMQPQGHVQVVVRTVVYGQNPQAACDAPRWYVSEHGTVALEPEVPVATRDALSARGHVLLERAPTELFGGAQIIHKMPNGYCAASDPRKDGQAVGS